jgi:undecaprenyl-diphosphatase
MKMQSILELDARLSDQMRVAEKPGALRAISVFFAHSGDSWFWAIGLFAVWIGGNSFWKEWAVVQFVGISLLAALVICIKFIVRRQRPQGEWGGIYRNTDPHSFPSGHAARAFLIAMVAAGFCCARCHGGPLPLGCCRGRAIGNCDCSHWFADL